jgi:hypothetical protein
MPRPTARWVLAVALLAATAAYVCLDLVLDPTSLGPHDWDLRESERLLVVESIRRYGQFPFWNPYGCGGFAAWAAPESTSVVISPVLVVYLLLPLAPALRVEIVATLVFGLTGTWLLAKRFVRDPLIRMPVCIIGFLSSRWALQAAAGHVWHLHYAWLPWALWAFLRARDEPRGNPPLWLALTAAILAMMIYSGATYPFPHTLLALALCAVYLAVRARSWRPVGDAVVAGAGGVALAAPKLFPLVDTLARFPRGVQSNEYQWPLDYLRALVEPHSGSVTMHVSGADWGFHEYGLYVGWLGLAALVAGVVWAPRERQHGELR